MSFNPFQNFNPKDLDPAVMAEMGELLRTLQPDQLQRVQTVMHNVMAGHANFADLVEVQKTLPPEFLEKALKLQNTVPAPALAGGLRAVPPQGVHEVTPPGDSTPSGIRQARLTVLNAVAQQTITPEEALQALFPI